MNFSLKEICQKINGIGVGEMEAFINSTSGIENSIKNSICYLDNINFEKIICSGNLKASALLIENKLINNLSISLNEVINKNVNLKTIIKVDNAKEAFVKVLSLFKKKIVKNNIETPSFVAKSVKLGKENYVGAFSYIGEETEIDDSVKIFPNCYIGENVKIGKKTIIYSGVKIYDNSKIKSNCIIHSGAVIGADGFGFIPKTKKNIKISHFGNVIIEDNVEIGANTCIDKGKTHTDSTIIKNGVKIDNLVQIGHNVEIGENTMIAGCTGIAGSTKIGKNCLIGGKVAIADHIKIADNIKIAGNSGVTKSFNKKGIIIQGPIAFEKSKFQKSYIHFKNMSQKK